MIAYLARIELRRRWRSVVLLGLLVALVVGTVLTSVAGARRSRSAFDRYLDGSSPIDVGVFASDAGALDAVGALPEVKDSARIELAAIFPTEISTEEFFPMLISIDGLLPYKYMRPIVLEGRVPDPDEPLAVALGERTARRLGKQVGDQIPMAGFTAEGVRSSFDDSGDTAPPDGPTFALDVVGIVRDAGDITGRETDVAMTMLTPAFRDRYSAVEIGDFGLGALIVLADGITTSELTEATADLDVQIDPTITPEASRGQADPTMAAIATALYVFAGVVALAGVVAIAQAVNRNAQAALVDDRTLAALGVQRAGRWGRIAAPPAVAVVAGTAIGVMAAVAASPLMPVGLARRAEPDTGIDVDGVVLGAGALVALLIGLGVAVMAAALAARGQRTVRGVDRPSRLAGAAAESGAPPSVVTGLSLAVSRRSSNAAASRAAVGGAAIGVLGLVAAIIFATSVDRLVESPRLYGWGWDANIAGADTSHVPEGATDERSLVMDPDIEAVAEAIFSLEISLDGAPEFATALDDRKGHIGPIMISGREPSGTGEVALAAETLSESGKQIGDSVTIDLGQGPADLRITGVTALPVSGDGGSSTRGALMRGEAVDALGFSGCDSDVSCYRNVAVEVRGDADLDQVLERYSDPANGVDVDRPAPPGEVERLIAVERLPWFLAGFLALLAGVAVAHGATTTVRRRRRDLAILRVLGLTGGQVRTVVTTQTAVVSVAGAFIGAALGVVVGRQVWRTVVDSVPLPFSPAAPIVAVVGIVVATLLLAQLAAAMPRRAAGRLRPAAVLRAE